MGASHKHFAVILAMGIISPCALAQPNVSTAVNNALAFLSQRTLAWKDDHSCASCHHAPLMLWSAEIARSKGYPVDEDAVSTVRTWLLAPDNEARLLPGPNPPEGRDNFAPAAALTVLALKAGPQDDAIAPIIKEFRENFLQHQERDGSFLINGPFNGTAPILEGGAIGTLIASLAFDAIPDTAQPARQAATWLAVYNEPPSQQELALRLLLAALHARHAEIAPLADLLLALQREDGSWSQTSERSGDAYATGQALFALAAAGYSSSASPIERGVRFLLQAQRPEGDWPVLSRLIKPGDSAPRENEPIVAAGTAWALLGILAGTDPKE